MINCINFLPKGINIKNLKKYEKNEEIVNSLKHLNIPVLDEDSEFIEDFEDETNFIIESDLLICSTPNGDDMSYIQFHLYDQEENDFVLHHDVYVFSSINDAAYINLDNNHYMALATFEDSLMLYDSLVMNPMTPQLLLKGHSGPIMSVCVDGSTLYSGSEDKKIIKWDIEKCVPNRFFDTKIEVDKICVSDNFIFYTNKNDIFLNDTDIQINAKGTVENIKLSEGNIYVSDSEGYFYKYDCRNLKKSIFKNKIFNSAVTGLDICDDRIGLCSKEGEIKILKKDQLTDAYNHKVKVNLFSIKLHPDNIIFYGDDTDSLNMKKYDDILF